MSFVNEAAFFVAEYNNRQKLYKLGFTEPLESLDAITAEYFIEIAHVNYQLDQAEAKKGAK